MFGMGGERLLHISVRSAPPVLLLSLYHTSGRTESRRWGWMQPKSQSCLLAQHRLEIIFPHISSKLQAVLVGPPGTSSTHGINKCYWPVVPLDHGWFLHSWYYGVPGTLRSSYAFRNMIPMTPLKIDAFPGPPVGSYPSRTESRAFRYFQEMCQGASAAITWPEDGGCQWNPPADVSLASSIVLLGIIWLPWLPCCQQPIPAAHCFTTCQLCVHTVTDDVQRSRPVKLRARQ